MVTLLLFATPAASSTRVAIEGCAFDSEGSLLVSSPSPSQSFARGDAVLTMTVTCDGGVNFYIGVDEIGYDLSNGMLVPKPEATKGCERLADISECWPVLGAAFDQTPEETFSYPIQVGPGTHTLRIRPAIQGTSPPTFGDIRVQFVVGSGRLPMTGFTAPVVWATIVIAIGAVLNVSSSIWRWRIRKKYQASSSL